MSDDSAVAVVSMARTPFGKFGGSLRDVDVRDLGAAAIRQAVDRASIADDEIGEVILGVNFPGSRRSIARQAALRAGLPETSDALTVDRACCSSLTAIRLASRNLGRGGTTLAVAGGTENLSQVPYFLEQARFGQRLGQIVLDDPLVISCPHTGVSRAVQVANEAATLSIGRVEQDEWALRSHEMFWAALESDQFPEVFPIATELLPGARDLAVDESARQGVTLAGLSELSTVNGSETVTPGNAPGLSTGASAVVLASPPRARSEDCRPLARITSFGIASGSPEAMGRAATQAGMQALSNAGLDVGDVHVIEINEAFAAVPLMATAYMAQGDSRTAEVLRSRTNLRGGAVAIGHPTGATGARLIMSAVQALTNRGGGIGLVAICGGIGEAEAAVIEVDQV